MHNPRSTSCIVRIAAVALAMGFLASTASAAKGNIADINMPQNHGTIIVTEGGDAGAVYNYNVNAGDTNPPDYVPQVGDRVTFTPRGRRATNVTLIEDPGIPGDQAGNDTAASSAIRPASAALGLLAVGGLYGARRRQRECV